MIYAKTNPIGLDALIAQAQDKLESLETLWGVPIDIYPRCYPKWDKEVGQPDRRKGIEHYIGNNEYSGNLIHAEGNKFFFTAADDEDAVGNGYETTKLKLYVIVDLSKAYPSIAHRCDMEVRRDVKAIMQTIPNIRLDETVTQPERVFSGYGYEIGDDLQPYHAFRLDLTAFEYDINLEYCN